MLKTVFFFLLLNIFVEINRTFKFLYCMSFDQMHTWRIKILILILVMIFY